jgi:RNA polymerase sigma-70 factor (ECF subfamily)
MITEKLVRLEAELTLAHHDYEKKLNYYALNKVQDLSLSEDLVQQAFMKTWIYLVKRGKIELMQAFLYHVLKNLIIDEYRKNKPSSLDALIEKGFEPRERSPGSIEDQIDGKAAMQLINFLPEKYKRVMQLRYIQDLSHKEIQLITGQSKNTIAVQAHRGLEKLRILYQH